MSYDTYKIILRVVSNTWKCDALHQYKVNEKMSKLYVFTFFSISNEINFYIFYKLLNPLKCNDVSLSFLINLEVLRSNNL